MKHLRTFEGYNNNSIDDIKACVQDLVDEYTFELHNVSDRLAYHWDNANGETATSVRLQVNDKLLKSLEKCAKKLETLNKTYTIKVEIGVASINEDGSVDDAEYASRTFMDPDIATGISSITEELYGILYANAYVGSDTGNFRSKIVKFIESMDIQVMKAWSL